METNNFLRLFDDYIVAPGFNRSDISKWFSTNKHKEINRGVYAILNYKLEILYIGSSIDLHKRLPHHLYQEKLSGYFQEVLLIGIKYVEGDVTTPERKYIRELKPKLNKYRYNC
ncbi:GIY-YIG nuclease family protein [Metabacillus dongyingensis]|uniref:GIY-YIG nuclease family protein n=1 Tax=Metabacillus dongyingensis TaxID=2874282 RepID=UPI001CBBAF7B|nr:GIY-YIG nuclease family protein [Metabacillus dongyingensis]UAL52285.1 GIY-YIG nuclease family protein [Metabacillus dongyingensis]